ncbi:MAG: methyltransferase protein, partial [Ramlibacter sp.]|nr:methyltransferase protein [Ramlibacter sp.]
MSPNSSAALPYVEETRFGKWFLRTETWRVHVLERAIADLVRLIPQPRASYGVVVDVGCGSGYSLPKLAQRFSPRDLVGVDIDPQMLRAARAEADRAGIQPRLVEASSTRMPLDDASVDLLFCHQTFHHLVEQDEALAEFLRVLKPGGVLLFAESTRRYIHSWIIRALFRHPMEVQRTAPEYLQML